MEFFSWNALTTFFVSGHSNWRVDDMEIKLSPKQFPSGICDGYVNYEEAEVDRLDWKQITVADRVEYSKQPASGCLKIIAR